MQEAGQAFAVRRQAVDKTALVAGHYDLPVFRDGGDVVVITQAQTQSSTAEISWLAKTIIAATMPYMNQLALLVSE